MFSVQWHLYFQVLVTEFHAPINYGDFRILNLYSD